MNDDTPSDLTPFARERARIIRANQRRDVLQLLRQGGFLTAALRRDAVKTVRGWTKAPYSLSSDSDRDLTVHIANALEKGREATAALLRTLLEEEYAEGLTALQNMED